MLRRVPDRYAGETGIERSRRLPGDEEPWKALVVRLDPDALPESRVEQAPRPLGAPRPELDQEVAGGPDDLRRVLDEPRREREPVRTRGQGSAGLVGELGLEPRELRFGDVRGVGDDEVRPTRQPGFARGREPVSGREADPVRDAVPRGIAGRDLERALRDVACEDTASGEAHGERHGDAPAPRSDVDDQGSPARAPVSRSGPVPHGILPIVLDGTGRVRFGGTPPDTAGHAGEPEHLVHDHLRLGTRYEDTLVDLEVQRMELLEAYDVLEGVARGAPRDVGTVGPRRAFIDRVPRLQDQRRTGDAQAPGEEHLGLEPRGADSRTGERLLPFRDEARDGRTRRSGHRLRP